MNGGAQHWFHQFIDANGNPYAGVKVYHYAAGASTDKNVWADEAKTTLAAQPVIGDSRGMVWFYGDGDYRLKITDSSDNVIYDWDSVKITSDTATMWEGNFGTTYPAAATANRGHLFALLDGSNLIKELGINDDGTAFHAVPNQFLNTYRTEKYTSFAAAVTAIGSAAGTLVVSQNEVVSTAVTVPSTLSVLFIGAGKLTKSGSGSVTFNGPIIAAPGQQIFSAFISGITIAVGKTDVVYPQWWGAVGDAVADDTEEIQAAVNSFAALPNTSNTSGTVYLPPGDYAISTPILITKTGMSLVGAGYDVTTLRKSTGAGNVIQIGTPDDYTNRVDHVSIKNLKIHGLGSTDYGIIATHTHYSRFENLWIRSIGTPIFLDFSWTNSFANIKITAFSSKGVWLKNSSNTITFEHLYINATGGSAVPSSYLQAELSTGSSVHGLICEGGAWTDSMLYIKQTEGFGVFGFYFEFVGTNFSGTNIVRIGSPTASELARTVTLENGYINFEAGSGDTTLQNVILMAAGATGSGVRNVIISNVRMDHTVGSWSGDFVEVGSGNTAYDTQIVTISNVFASSAGGSPKGLRLNSDVKRFVGINNRWPTNTVVANAAGWWMVDNENGRQSRQIVSLNQDDDTPTVYDGDYYKTNSTVATTITKFDDGANGQHIYIMANDANTTFSETASGSTLKMSTDTFTMSSFDVIEFVYDGTWWYEVSRSVN